MTVEHDAEARRFHTEVDGHPALLDYRLAGNLMTITHTEVAPEIGGRGIAGELMRAALDTAARAGWRVLPACSYAVSYLQRHPQADQTLADPR